MTVVTKKIKPFFISKSDRIEVYKMAVKRIEKNSINKIPSYICLEIIDILKVTDSTINTQGVLRYFPELKKYQPTKNLENFGNYSKWFFEVPYTERDKYRIKVLEDIIYNLQSEIKPLN